MESPAAAAVDAVENRRRTPPSAGAAGDERRSALKTSWRKSREGRRAPVLHRAPLGFLPLFLYPITLSFLLVPTICTTQPDESQFCAAKVFCPGRSRLLRRCTMMSSITCFCFFPSSGGKDVGASSSEERPNKKLLSSIAMVRCCCRRRRRWFVAVVRRSVLLLPPRTRTTRPPPPRPGACPPGR